MSDEIVRIGTRGSPLALWQAEWVKSQLESNHAGITVELVIIKTTGDKILDVPLAMVGGKGLFVKELEEALLDGRVDLAVHSMKDVPAEFPAGLGLSVILEREDPRDALLSSRYKNLEDLPQGAKVGSSSLRRQCQLLHLRPDLKIESLRGNVGTRIGKLESGDFDAIMLAAAGVKRLKTTDRVVEYLDQRKMVPAIGQGAVGVETRENDPRMDAMLAPLNHSETALCVKAERAFLARLEGGCQVPIAGHAILKDGRIHMHGLVGSLDGKTMLHLDQDGPMDDPLTLGREMADDLLKRGAADILKEVYHP